MTDQSKHDFSSILIAIDIAKNSHDAAIEMPYGHRKYLRFDNSLAGYRELLDAAQVQGGFVIAGFEPTADFYRNIACWLQAQGVQCVMVASLACARVREMLYKSWDRTLLSKWTPKSSSPQGGEL